jgi:lipopolysaccharide export system permease protein
MRIESGEARARIPTAKTMETNELLAQRSARNLAELSWRIGVPLSALILSLLAIPLSFVNPRAGRSGNLVAAILLYMIYSNMLSVAQASIAQSRISFGTGFAIHAAMLTMLLVLFYRRVVMRPLARLFR